MKTAVIWIEDGPQYFVANGDWTRFNDIIIGEDTGEALEDELNELIFDANGDYKIKFITLEEFAQAIRDGAQVIECGFAL